jgi:hypothetical protein
MAFRNFSKGIFSLSRDLVVLAATAKTAGSSAFTAPNGNGLTLARSGVGTATVTLGSGLSFADLLFVDVTLRNPALADNNVQVLTWVPSTGVLTLQCFAITSDSPAAAEWPAADADAELMVYMLFRNTGQEPSQSA